MNDKFHKILSGKMGVGTLIMLAFISLPLFSQQNHVSVGEFSNMDLSEWDQKSFSGKTSYEINSQSELAYLYASADNSASALYKKVKVDLNTTPYLNWEWRVDNPLPEMNEQTKAGDDYSARVYVIVKRGFAPWKTKALNYVWSSQQSPRKSWPNAFTDKAMMISLRTSLDANQQWVSERVNVKLDFEKHFGIEVNSIDGVAIMVDTDNSGLQAAASFGDVYFSSK
jgi:hypothetical protein|tara:strand:- start:1309 stop:1986 length:678 start_codon:yes stop_codon:yes gene_type:complete